MDKLFRNILCLAVAFGAIAVFCNCLSRAGTVTQNLLITDSNDPNGPTEPGPEYVGLGIGGAWLSDDPNDPNEPGPERTMLGSARIRLMEDPNEPEEPGPELV